MAKSPTLVAQKQHAAAVAADRAAHFPGRKNSPTEARAGISLATGKRKKRAVYTNAQARHNQASVSLGGQAKPGAAPAKQSVGKPAMNMQEAHARLAKRLAAAGAEKRKSYAGA